MPKNWNYTGDNCIRISDHWNYESNGRIHSETDNHHEIHQHRWAKGRWNSDTKTYHIIELYELNTKEEFDVWRLKQIEKITRNKKSEEVIEFGRFLHDMINNGKVFYDDGENKGMVIKYKRGYLDIVKEDGEKLRIEEYWKKDHILTIDGIKYTSSEMEEKSGRKY